MRSGQVFGGTGGGACPRCGQYDNACHCAEDSQKLADQIAASIAEPERPLCRHCGKTWWQHASVAGIGYVCPIAVFTYEPVSPESAR